MTQKMKLSEVAVYLGKSAAMIYNYRNNGLLHSEKVGRETFFDRDEVVEFAKSRGIRTLESGVPQGTNFMDRYRLAQEIAEQVILILKQQQEAIIGKV